MAKTVEERINEFFTDPKHSNDADFMRGSVKKIFAEIAAEEEERNKKKKKEKPSESFLARLFSDSGEQDNSGNE